MIDLQKRIGQVPDPACSGVLSPERPNCGWLKPSEQAPIPELAAPAKTRLPVSGCKKETGISSPSGTLPSGVTAGAKRPRFSRLCACPSCGGHVIKSHGLSMCAVCDWNNFVDAALATRSAARPMGMNASSSDPSIMSHPDMTRIENAQNSFASGANE